MEDSFNASGKARSRQRKAIALARKAPRGAAPGASIPQQMATEASQGNISEQANEGFSGVDGFDNSDGKKLTPGMKAFGIGAMSTVLVVALIFGVLKLTGRGKKK